LNTSKTKEKKKQKRKKSATQRENNVNGEISATEILWKGVEETDLGRKGWSVHQHFRTRVRREEDREGKAGNLERSGSQLREKGQRSFTPPEGEELMIQEKYQENLQGEEEPVEEERKGKKKDRGRINRPTGESTGSGKLER